MRLGKTSSILIISAVILLGVPLSHVGYLWITYIDESITKGEGYGFTIGQSKSVAYDIAAQKFRAGDIVALDSLSGMDEERERFPESLEPMTILEVERHFDQWDTWLLSFGGRLTTAIEFERGFVIGAGRPGKPDRVWRAGSGERVITITPGQSYNDVYRSLVALAELPEYEDMLLETGWMARRQPGTFDETEFRFVKPSDDWALLVDEKHGYFNRIDLHFREHRLVEIRRHRQYFEWP